MAYKSQHAELQQREQRQQRYLAAPVISSKFPSARELVVELRFVDPEGKAHPSPHKQIFTADMQAYFEFACPLRECAGGGYSLGKDIPAALGRRKEAGGSMACTGKRKRPGGQVGSCGLELHYRVNIRSDV